MINVLNILIGYVISMSFNNPPINGFKNNTRQQKYYL